MSDNWQQEVLDFWFETLTPREWFAVSEETDTLIRERFSPLHER
ncbi:DUF924 family protein [Nitratireductor aquibiodomus]|nr:DUF924 family protein [Nitratireductor aquibiodomus]